MNCTRCGKCCIAYPCVISWVLFNPNFPEDIETPVHSCPALEREGDEASCGLVMHPDRYVELSDAMVEAFKFLMYEHLAIGEGCGAQSPSGERLIKSMWEFAERSCRKFSEQNG